MNGNSMIERAIYGNTPSNKLEPIWKNVQRHLKYQDHDHLLVWLREEYDATFVDLGFSKFAVVFPDIETKTQFILQWNS